jgi:hypothetical protein
VGLNSCLYECVVGHRRLSPKRHAFEHRIMMLYIDLDELEAIRQRSRLLSLERFNLYSFRDADHCPTGTPGTLKQRVITFAREHAIDMPAKSRIRLLTMPRVLGYIFNPISIYFCNHADGRALCAIAEVGNTFRETKLFMLAAADLSAPGQATANAPARFRLRAPKHYYVSPFSRLDICFDFDCLMPDATLQVHIDDWDGSQKLLESHLRGRRVALSDHALLFFALKFPLLTLKVIGLIHWHALRLALKRLPWHRKAEHPELQRDVLNPTTPPTSRSERHAH